MTCIPDVLAPYLDAAAGSGRSQVAAIGYAQEFQLVWTARKRDTDPGGCPQFSFLKQRRVSVFYACQAAVALDLFEGLGRAWNGRPGARVHLRAASPGRSGPD